jgi:hypothetical protein
MMPRTSVAEVMSESSSEGEEDEAKRQACEVLFDEKGTRDAVRAKHEEEEILEEMR